MGGVVCARSIFLLLWVLLLALQSSRGTPMRPRVVVAELFRDIFRTQSPPTNRNICPITKMHWRTRKWRAPWLSIEDAHRTRLPSLYELNRTLLSASSIFNTTRAACANSSLLGLHTQTSPPGLCIHAVTPGGRPLLFDQYGIEVQLLSRFLQAWPICKPTQNSTDHACDSDVVVLPSLIFHYVVALGRRGWGFNKCVRLAEAYWKHVAARFYAPGQLGPVLLTTEAYAWDSKMVNATMHSLAHYPAEFKARIVMLTSMSNMPTALERVFRASADAPRASIAPALVWSPGGMVEIRRRDTLLHALHSTPRNAQGKVRLSNFGAPLLLTVPRSLGAARPVEWYTSYRGYSPSVRSSSILWDAALYRTGFLVKGQYIRQHIAKALRAAGAMCTRTLEKCVICADGLDSCTATSSVYAEAANSIICIEPPGDVIGRSHTYVSIHSGCIPALIDGGHHGFSETEPTWWPWRCPDAESCGTSGILELDYSEFSVILSATDIVSKRRRWVTELLCLARNKSRLRAMRTRLHEVSKLMLISPTDCGKPRCDAFAVLHEVVAYAWNQIHVLRTLHAATYTPTNTVSGTSDDGRT